MHEEKIRVFLKVVIYDFFALSLVDQVLTKLQLYKLSVENVTKHTFNAIRKLSLTAYELRTRSSLTQLSLGKVKDIRDKTFLIKWLTRKTS